MDRQIVYAGSIPLDTDLLLLQRNVMVSLGALAHAVLGDGGVVDGMGCVPGGGAYTVVVAPGSYTTLLPLDSSAFGSLPADATPVAQTAWQPDSAVLQLGPPPAPGQVICWLVQARAAQLDAGPVALTYWNAANPNVPFTGPNNSGQAQATQRTVRVLLSVKASAPQAPEGATPPPPDAGWVGLHAVTTYAGKPGIEPGDIAAIPEAPRLRYPLPLLPPGATRQEVLTTGTSWRAPPGVWSVRVRVVGGGGGGGGGDSGYSGGGGGSGGYGEAYVPVRPGQVYGIAIGAGGGSGGPLRTGSTGGTTSFAELVKATGGRGGGAHNPDSHGGQPGQGILGSLAQSGGYGGDGAAAALVPGGIGGASAFGGGGRGADQGGAPANGQSFGSGGGGGYGAASAGGIGANGAVIIEY